MLTEQQHLQHFELSLVEQYAKATGVPAMRVAEIQIGLAFAHNPDAAKEWASSATDFVKEARDWFENLEFSSPAGRKVAQACRAFVPPRRSEL